MADVISYSYKNLKAILRANHESISLESLMKGFGLTPDSSYRLISDLKRLKDEGFIKSKGSNFYTPVAPISDLAIARVSETRRNGRYVLKLEGLDEDLPIPVTLANRRGQQNKLKKNDRVLVRLSRHHGFELKALFTQKLSVDKKPILTGKFKKVAGQGFVFISSDKAIKTEFKVSGAVPSNPHPHQLYVAVIPGKIAMNDPAVEITEQRWDPETGNKIAHILAQKHSLLTRHTRDAYLSARKIKRYDNFYSEPRRIFEREDILVVDPANSPGDFDDGIFAETTPDGLLRTLTVVTDVASYIAPHSRLDKYALERGRSYYFPQEREFFHMFPESLSLSKMALREGHDHPVIYVEQFYDPMDGALVSSKSGLGIVRNHSNLTYEQFQNFLNSDTPESRPYTKFDNFAWAKDSDEKLQLSDNSPDYNQSIVQAKAIVQAMMNRYCVAMAEELEDHDALFISRNHAGHYNDMAYDLDADTLRGWGYEVPYNAHELTPAVLNGIINEASVFGLREKMRVEGYIREKLLYRAEYSLRAIGHFGVASAYYGHFTSPIRRYADLFNQRSYHTAQGIPYYGLSDEMEDRQNAQKIVNHLNTIDQRASVVARDSEKYYAIMEMRRHEGQKIIATLNAIHQNDDVEIILRTGIRRLIPAAQLPADWEIAPNKSGLNYQRSAYFGLGSMLRVKIGQVAPHRAEWSIEEMEPRANQPSNVTYAGIKQASQNGGNGLPRLAAIG